MLDLFVCWVLFPLALTAVAVGCGLLLQWASGIMLPRALLPAAGFAVVLVAGHIATASDATAPVAAPLVVALAIAGFAVGFPLRRGVDWWAVAVGLRGVRGVRGARGAVRRCDVRGVHQARRHGHVARDDGPADGARPRPQRAAALVLRGGARREPQRRLSGRRLPPARHRGEARRPGPGMGVPALPGTARRVHGPRAVHGQRAARSARGRCARVPRSWRARPRCCSRTRSGAESRSWPRRGPSPCSAPCCFRSCGKGSSAFAVLPLAFASAALLAVLSFGGIVWLAPMLIPAAIVLARLRGPGMALASERRVPRLHRGAVAADAAAGRGLPEAFERNADQRDRAREPDRAAQPAAGRRDLAGRRLPVRARATSVPRTS